ncbi:MAG: hypothetical protein ETSY1_36035 [Candidatus Entotheonella factor]|uniref:Uncharacterized protein n=1 Tax=Entotheonella factor TaxID=1429438 RepID=W4L7W8_ENTF1|nr:hypothetical protein [Candidatus Entotheonella palauensis]ETW94168.1 MAG: hypothetical protein ETSY1_36035 [Candidatus Entotheonella factor]
MRWLTWSYLPGLHWLAWLQAGFQARYPSYYLIGLLYALPTLFVVVARAASLRFVVLSWIIHLLHVYVQQSAINRRIARIAQGASVFASEEEALRQALLRAALEHGGALTVTQGVMATGATFTSVEQTLNLMVASGYVFTRENPETGLLEYVFTEMI